MYSHADFTTVGVIVNVNTQNYNTSTNEADTNLHVNIKCVNTGIISIQKQIMIPFP